MCTEVIRPLLSKADKGCHEKNDLIACANSENFRHTHSFKREESLHCLTYRLFVDLDKEDTDQTVQMCTLHYL